MMKRRAPLAFVAFVVASSAAVAVEQVEPAPPPADATKAAFAKAWRALGQTKNQCSATDLHYDYWPEGGIRNFYCRAITALSLQAVTTLSGVEPFTRGPHLGGGSLSLHDPRDFGRYNPAFVQFLVDNAIPAADDALLREETQAYYDNYVKQLARVYFVVHQRLEKRADFKKKMRNEYLRVMDEKKPDWGAYYDKFSTFLGEADANWGGYDPNLQSASVAWWLRRDVDKSAPIFFEGLTKLLRTYDAAWLESQSKQQQSARKK